ncbi:hypothetical protein RSOLAG22IIIB_12067 [Rhizoctonia solani]|uniref:Uncharacterized protein n=1 Tax=Rhizoctonia solani TaxID=456999 RepID=A0A0K6GC02_9AGAM|nr:hypothetical protein RSOLAG22IIIB_12067 [Rhizoctonia solani]
MNPDSISTQPTIVPKMQMTIEGAEANEHKDNDNLASRTRGGGAAKACFIGALSCFLCCECMECCCGCVASIVCCPCEVCCSCCC